MGSLACFRLAYKKGEEGEALAVRVGTPRLSIEKCANFLRFK